MTTAGTSLTISLEPPDLFMKIAASTLDVGNRTYRTKKNREELVVTCVLCENGALFGTNLFRG
jgi:hypothetical protein